MPIFANTALQRYQVFLNQSTPPAIVEPDRRPTPNWPYAVLAAGQGADALTTGIALQRPEFREANPMGAKATMISKAAMAALTAYLMHKAAKRGDTKTKKALGIGMGLAGAIPAAWNIRQLAK